MVSSYKSRVNFTFSSCIFQSKNIISRYPFIWCLLYNLKDCFFRCVVSIFYHGDRKLIFHVRHGMEFCRLVLYELGTFQVRLDVQNLGKFEKLIGKVHFYKCKSLSI